MTRTNNDQFLSSYASPSFFFGFWPFFMDQIDAFYPSHPCPLTRSLHSPLHSTPLCTLVLRHGRWGFIYINVFCTTSTKLIDVSQCLQNMLSIQILGSVWAKKSLPCFVLDWSFSLAQWAMFEVVDVKVEWANQSQQNMTATKKVILKLFVISNLRCFK